MATAAPLAAHSVHPALPDDLPLLEIDAGLIERVLCNLLEDAAKFTPAGTPISISAAVRGSEVDVWVDDSRPGFPKGREEAIFEKFERGARESATPGVGLGLAICRAIVAAHGGSIHAENRAGGGGTLVMTVLQQASPRSENRPVLLVAYDTPPPTALQAFRPVAVPFGVALLLTPRAIPGSIARLRGLRIRAGAADALLDVGLERLRLSNPAARSLPLLQRLAAGHTGMVTLPYLPETRLELFVEPC